MRQWCTNRFFCVSMLLSAHVILGRKFVQYRARLNRKCSCSCRVGQGSNFGSAGVLLEDPLKCVSFVQFAPAASMTRKSYCSCPRSRKLIVMDLASAPFIFDQSVVPRFSAAPKLSKSKTKPTV